MDAYYATFKGKTVDLYKQNKSIVRHFRLPYEVINVQVTGVGEQAMVMITMKNGKTWVYRSTGQIVRT